MNTLQVPAKWYDEALLLCNTRRIAQNKEPITELPPGRAYSVESCPCANTCEGLEVYETTWNSRFEELWDENVGHPRGFVKYFDEHAGKFRDRSGFAELVQPIRDESLPCV